MGVANGKTQKTMFLLQEKYQLESDPPNLLTIYPDYTQYQ